MWFRVECRAVGMCVHVRAPKSHIPGIAMHGCLAYDFPARPLHKGVAIAQGATRGQQKKDQYLSSASACAPSPCPQCTQENETIHPKC
eukprot:5144266-Amphidinium_carterae.1